MPALGPFVRGPGSHVEEFAIVDAPCIEKGGICGFVSSGGLHCKLLQRFLVEIGDFCDNERELGFAMADNENVSLVCTQLEFAVSSITVEDRRCPVVVLKHSKGELAKARANALCQHSQVGRAKTGTQAGQAIT